MPAVPGLANPHLRGPGAPGESGHLGGGVPDRPGVEHHLCSDRGPWRARAARHRLGYVKHTFLRTENYAAANPHLVTAQAGIGFRQALGGGLVAAIDGMRFVVPVPSAHARPNKKHFGPKRGITWSPHHSDAPP